MALSATVRRLQLDISDIDRGVYESLPLKLAQHPSESPAYLATRVLAFALEYAEGIEFTTGLADTDLPPVWRRDLTGRLLQWVDVGTPAAARLHKASKAADAVAVYCHKKPAPWLRTLAGSTVHQAESLRLVALPPAEMAALGDALGRRSAWQVTRTEGVVYLDTESGSHELVLERLTFPV